MPRKSVKFLLWTGPFLLVGIVAVFLLIKPPVLKNTTGGWSSGHYNFGLRKLGDAKTVTLAMALHRSRFAEFTAKPAKN